MSGHRAPSPATSEPLPAVAMPLGGIGTGGLAIGADGGLRQWQLHNRGNHRGELPGSLLALRVQQLEPTLSEVMALQTPRTDPGALGRPATPMVNDDLVPQWQRELLQHHRGTVSNTFTGTYPIAELEFDTGTPVIVRARWTSPMQPWHHDLSSLPAVLLEVEVENTSDVVTRVWLAAAWHNAVGLDPALNPRGVRAPGYGGNTNTLRRVSPLEPGSVTAHLVMDNQGLDPFAPGAGQQVLSCRADSVWALPQFEHPDELFDWLTLLAPWGDHTKLGTHPGVQTPQNSAPLPRHGASPQGQTWLGALAGHTELHPGQTRTMQFAMAWHYPNRYLDFVQFGPDRPELGPTRFWLGNHYTTRWPDAVAVADHVLGEWDQLWASTREWTRALESLDLPGPWVQHLGAQAVPLRSPSVFQTHDGTCYGFEGVLGASTVMWSGDVGGSCPLNCTHVWNYSMASAALWPGLERSMRETEWDVMQAPDGTLPHRVYLPTYLGQLWDVPIGGPDQPALDGMCGAVLKTYRELRRGAIDLGWLRQRWTKVVALMDHIARGWDPECTGLLHGVQPSTHDIGLTGANSYMGTYWLAALRAAEEMARLLDDSARAQDWRHRFEVTSTATDAALFQNGYYVQVPDPDQPLTHQWGEGCLADQLIGQWWANTCDLGPLLPREHVREALSHIVAHNFHDHHDETSTAQRAYAVRGEWGLAMCSWPRGGRPEVPTMYCDEVWTGSEYQVAAHCLQEGLIDEGHRLVEAIWARHDGTRRNPYNEVECGDHYVRSMAGWSVLEAELGLDWNAVTGCFRVGREGVSPLLTGTGWGLVEVRGDQARLRVMAGQIGLQSLELRPRTGREGVHRRWRFGSLTPTRASWGLWMSAVNSQQSQ